MSATNSSDATGLHPTARPSEKRQDIEFNEKDTGLRHDVHDLGAMVGELLKEQAGDALFDIVESARRTAIDRREGDHNAGKHLEKLVHSLSPLAARNFVRAFSNIFSGRQHRGTGPPDSTPARLFKRHIDPSTRRHRRNCFSTQGKRAFAG